METRVLVVLEVLVVVLRAARLARVDAHAVETGWLCCIQIGALASLARVSGFRSRTGNNAERSHRSQMLST